MYYLSKFLLSVLKAIVSSILVTLIGFVLTVSLITKQFPPSWTKIQAISQNVQRLVSQSSRVLNSDQNKITQMIEKLESASGYNDPALEDIKSIQKYHQDQARLSQELTGEMTFASTPPPAEAGHSRVVQIEESEKNELKARIKNLEELVRRMQIEMQQLHQKMK